MPVTIREIGRSRAFTVSNSERGGDRAVTLRFWLYGSKDPGEIETELLNVIGDTFEGMAFDSYSLEVNNEKGDSWEAEVQYSTKRLPEGEYEISVDTAGGTTKVMQAFDYEDFGSSGFDSKGAINIDDQNRVEGIEIGVPQLSISCRARIPGDFITDSYVLTLLSLTYTMNDAEFLGFARGELLFLGTGVTIIPGESTDIDFKFAANPNISGLTLGAVSGIEKLGHDYLWCRYKQTEGVAGLQSVVDTVSVDRVYQFGDFDALKIGATV
ncbi:hypothetical protein [Rhodopirellula halodulae]|uniref:hypothetical protein n=1 Tax=Rhodopirellula halodulae TaxID=2894198 RepID=UPI001E2A8783|nr:hypothetical protein [Rhodopirellula sp. JC737]MCC9655279.1 hypothetical protein [Rhodopirellula sp. JC737]